MIFAARQRFLQQASDLAVLDRQNLRQHLDERDLTAEGVIEIRELHPDRPCPDDHQCLGDLLQQHGLRTAQHVRLIEW